MCNFIYTTYIKLLKACGNAQCDDRWNIFQIKKCSLCGTSSFCTVRCYFFSVWDLLTSLLLNKYCMSCLLSCLFEYFSIYCLCMWWWMKCVTVEVCDSRLPAVLLWSKINMWLSTGIASQPVKFKALTQVFSFSFPGHMLFWSYLGLILPWKKLTSNTNLGEKHLTRHIEWDKCADIGQCLLIAG